MACLKIDFRKILGAKEMSRLNRLDVWQQINGEQGTALCASCQYAIMVRDNSNTWQIEHIIKMKNSGPDILENTTTICLTCNTENKSFETTYDYMFQIETLTYEEYLALKNGHIARMKYIFDNPRIMLCIAKSKIGKPCENKKKPGQLVCGVHLDRASHHLEQYVEEFEDSWNKLLKKFDHRFLDVEYT
jgi:hypothetical protein